jgi:hypothetical protein
MMMIQVRGDFLDLINGFCPVGAGVDFDKPENIRIGFRYEFHDLIEMGVGSPHITGSSIDVVVIGFRGTCPISYIVNKNSHKHPPPPHGLLDCWMIAEIVDS